MNSTTTTERGKIMLTAGICCRRMADALGWSKGKSGGPDGRCEADDPGTVEAWTRRRTNP
jgi:hypothetical protein